MAKKAVVIGAGFAGLSAATFMSKAGWEVHVIEKHGSPGGRARQLKEQGFTFDMGPSWYWMPDVFERYFTQFGKKVSDYYELKRLDPSYRVYWKEGFTDLPAGTGKIREVFESIEPGAAKALDGFLNEAAYKYKTGIQKLVFKPGRSWSEFLDWEVIKGVFKLDVFNSVKRHVHKYFRHPRLRQLLEFPVLFLGALPGNTPALYTLMNHADMAGGTWYPDGGMYSIVSAMHELAVESGVHFHFNQEVTEIVVEKNSAKSLKTINNTGNAGTLHTADVIIGAADYHFIETRLLPAQYRSYSDSYWNSRVMAPSCILFYIGLNKRLHDIHHHSLFFDVPFDQHAKEIYTTRQWPSDPLFYVSAVSVTDNKAAPGGCENLFFLIPVASGLENDSEQLREEYFEKIIRRFELHISQPVRDAIIYKRSYANSDFEKDYNAFKGNAYGLANTLLQTAILKPSCRSKKIKNLFYAGQLTVPGPGVPPALISGEVVAKEVLKNFS